MPPLRVPADLVARAHADPLGDGPVLGHLLRERPLRAEGLVRRLRGGARRVSGLRGAWRALGSWCVFWLRALTVVRSGRRNVEEPCSGYLWLTALNLESDNPGICQC